MTILIPYSSRLNAFNIYESWRFLLRELDAVRAELWHLHPNKVFHDELLLMGEEEWLAACEKMLRTNASFGIAQFLELISTRVLLESLAKRHRGLKNLNSWAAVLCPRALSSLSIEQLKLQEHLPPLISSVKVTITEDHSPCLLSTSVAEDVRPGRLSVPSLGIAPPGDFPLKVTVSEFATLQIRRIADEILSSQELLQHAQTAIENLSKEYSPAGEKVYVSLSPQRMTEDMATLF